MATAKIKTELENTIPTQLVLTPKSLLCRGVSTLNLWGGGQGEVVMKSWTVELDSSDEEIIKGVNDGCFGCESIEKADIDVFVVYSDSSFHEATALLKSLHVEL